MDLSSHNISEILKKGLSSHAFSYPLLHASTAHSDRFTSNPQSRDVAEIISAKADLIRERIGRTDALTLHRDGKLYNGKEYFHLLYQDTPTAYVLSKLLSEELRNACAIKFSDRNQLIENLDKSFFLSKPDIVIRSDIKSFFESVCHRKLFEKLKSEERISDLSIRSYQRIFDEFERHRTHNIRRGYGLPRGLAISSYLAEFYLQQIDNEIRNLDGVSFYGRYVDDIIILYRHRPENGGKQVFNQLNEIFGRSGLSLHPIGDGKSSVIDVSRGSATIGDYLGYALSWGKDSRTLSFGLTDTYLAKKKGMIDNAFSHFERLSRKNIKQSRRDLIDCINMISSNYKLSGGKKNIRTGIYYSHRHLTDYGCLDELTEYLQRKAIIPYGKSFSSTSEYLEFAYRLRARIQTVSYRRNWFSRRMISLSAKRISRLKAIMKNGHKSDLEVKAFDFTTHITSKS